MLPIPRPARGARSAEMARISRDKHKAAAAAAAAHHHRRSHRITATATRRRRAQKKDQTHTRGRSAQKTATRTAQRFRDARRDIFTQSCNQSARYERDDDDDETTTAYTMRIFLLVVVVVELVVQLLLHTAGIDAKSDSPLNTSNILQLITAHTVQHYKHRIHSTLT